MATRVLPWLPWLLAEGTLAWLEAQFWPDGGLWLLLIWTVVLLLYRTALAPTSRRSARLMGDVVFAGLCALAVFEGGWYLLPAVVAFAACDAAGLRIELPSLPDDAAGHELGAARLPARSSAGWGSSSLSAGRSTAQRRRQPPPPAWW